MPRPSTRRALGQRRTPATSDPVVETSSGRVRGVRAAGVSRFLGIPYAAPPVGRLRFRPPQPPEAWAGVADAAQYAAIAPQDAQADRTEEMSEDCLRLNVWTPSLTGSRPVVVWLHGGGFASGRAHGSYTDGDALAAGADVVAVNVAHRLAVLGHLHLERLCGDDFAGSGNAGMLDIVAALEWVRANIARFGGDPERVTVHGHSGGGGKAATIGVMPSAHGLFRRIAVHGGPPFGHKDSDTATDSAQRVLAALDVPADRPELLAALPLGRILDAQRGLGVHGVPGPDGMRFAPVIGTAALPLDPYDGFAAGEGRGTSLMIGTAADESRAAMFAWPYYRSGYEMGEAELERRIAPGFDDEADAAAVLRAYRSLDPDASGTDLFFAITSDQFRVRSLRLAAAKHAGDGQPAWAYLCTAGRPSAEGAFHGVQMPMFFGRPSPQADAAVSDAVAAEFARFAHDGLEASDLWRPHTPSAPDELVIGGSTVGMRTAPFAERLRAWDQAVVTPRTDPWTTLWRGPDPDAIEGDRHAH